MEVLGSPNLDCVSFNDEILLSLQATDLVL
jgi:hypothetical protein